MISVGVHEHASEACCWHDGVFLAEDALMKQGVSGGCVEPQYTNRSQAYLLLSERRSPAPGVVAAYAWCASRQAWERPLH